MPITLFLQTQPVAPTGGSPIGGMIFMYGSIFAIFYFLVIRPNQKTRKTHEANILAMKKGDQVVTAGGIVGEVVHIKEITVGTPSVSDHITVKSGESKLVIVRNRIASVGGSEAAAS